MEGVSLEGGPGDLVRAGEPESATVVKRGAERQALHQGKLDKSRLRKIERAYCRRRGLEKAWRGCRGRDAGGRFTRLVVAGLAGVAAHLGGGSRRAFFWSRKVRFLVLRSSRGFGGHGRGLWCLAAAVLRRKRRGEEEEAEESATFGAARP